MQAPDRLYKPGPYPSAVQHLGPAAFGGIAETYFCKRSQAQARLYWNLELQPRDDGGQPKALHEPVEVDVDVIRMAETEIGKVSLTPQRLPRISSSLSDSGIRYS